MKCECSDRMNRELFQKRASARARSDFFRRQLDAFQEGIKQGADALAIVHLYRAGLYLASSQSLSPEPSLSEIMDALEADLAGDEHELFRFMNNHRNEIGKEDQSVDKKKMLRGLLRQKEKAESLLMGLVVKEKDNAKRALDRAKKTAARLNTWKEGIRSNVIPELVRIAEMHEEL